MGTTVARRAGFGVALAALTSLVLACSSSDVPGPTVPGAPTFVSSSAGSSSGSAPSTVPKVPTVPTTSGAAVPATAADISAELNQSRVGIGARKMNVVITNSSTADLDILTADLTSGYLQKAVEPYRDGTVRAGAALALAFTLPAAICTPGATADPSVTIRYRSAGVEGTMTVVPVDTYGALEDVHRTDCAVDEIASLATLSFADELKVVDRDGTSTALLSLTLTPKATDRTLVVTELERTTLLVPAGTATWKPQGLNNSHGKPVTVDLEVIPARCDPHAVAEDKRGTFLGTHVTVDGQELPVVFTEIPQHTKGLIYQYVSDYCGW